MSHYEDHSVVLLITRQDEHQNLSLGGYSSMLKNLWWKKSKFFLV